MKRAFIGNGGHTNEVEHQIGEKLLRFVSDEFFSGSPNTKRLSEFNPNEYEVMITLGDSLQRYELKKTLPKETKYFSFIHPTSLLMDKNIKIGDGCFIGAYSILTCNISIGEHSILNRMVQIGHDCVIGDFFSAMPGSVVSGNVKIGEKVYLGSNSTIREKLEICDDVIIGLSSSVVKNIKLSGTYVGCPSKLLK